MPKKSVLKKRKHSGKKTIKKRGKYNSQKGGLAQINQQNSGTSTFKPGTIPGLGYSKSLKTNSYLPKPNSYSPKPDIGIFMRTMERNIAFNDQPNKTNEMYNYIITEIDKLEKMERK